MAHTGSWGTPDYGLTEKAQSGLNALWGALGGTSNAFGSQSKQGGSDFLPNFNQTSTPPPQTQIIKGGSTLIKPTTTPQNIPTNTTTKKTNVPQQSVSTQGQGQGQVQGASTGPSIVDQINAAYEAEQGYLSGLESQNKGEADRSRNLLTTEYNDTLPTYDAELATRQNELANREDSTRKDYYRGLGQVKQVLNDARNRQDAMLAYSGGGYNTSAKDALGEQLLRQSVQRVGAANDSLSSSVNAINTERSKTENFYADKKSTLKNSYLRGLNEIETQLQRNLGQVSAAKAQSASAKAQSTANAWQSYLDQKNQLQLTLYQFQQQLDAWREQKNQSLSDASTYTLGTTPAYNRNAGLIDSITVAPDQNPTVDNSSVVTAPIRSQARALTPEEQQQVNLYGTLGLNNYATFA